MKYGLKFNKLWENEMVVSYIDFVLFSELLYCVVSGCWEEYGKEKKNMTIA